jgi:hypothetical protein
MKHPLNRREFIMASSLVAVGLGFKLGSIAAPAPDTALAPLTFKTKPHKALIAHPTADDLKRMKEAGFEGVEGPASYPLRRRVGAARPPYLT